MDNPEANLGPSSEESTELPDNPPDDQPGESDWSGDDIEQAYQKALASMDDLPWDAGSDAAELTTAESEPTDGHPGDAPPPVASDSAPAEITTGTAPAARLAPGTERHPTLDAAEHSNVSPAQVIEAALFVGGGPLTAKKLCHVLRGNHDTAYVEQAIDDINGFYAAEGRPYEIRLGEGGYRLELRAEYEKLRQRVYGVGPREVKLSQEVLEVLALVAYQQPITQAEVESHGKENAGSLLRQLLRRDLVALQRGDGGRKDVRYHTTLRFLTVFGLASLDELPQPEDLARK